MHRGSRQMCCHPLPRSKPLTDRGRITTFHRGVLPGSGQCPNVGASSHRMKPCAPHKSFLDRFAYATRDPAPIWAEFGQTFRQWGLEMGSLERRDIGCASPFGQISGGKGYDLLTKSRWLGKRRRLAPHSACDLPELPRTKAMYPVPAFRPVGIIGLGYVGPPLALLYVDRSFGLPASTSTSTRLMRSRRGRPRLVARAPHFSRLQVVHPTERIGSTGVMRTGWDSRTERLRPTSLRTA